MGEQLLLNRYFSLDSVHSLWNLSKRKKFPVVVLGVYCVVRNDGSCFFNRRLERAVITKQNAKTEGVTLPFIWIIIETDVLTLHETINFFSLCIQLFEEIFYFANTQI